MEKYFVIGIGGTGMRAIEAFTHLCAIGMFDNKEIDILSIDTDTNNGNKGRSEQLIDRYIRIKGGASGKPTANSLFTAKLNIYKFAPEYSGNRSTFELISGVGSGSEEVQRANKALSTLLFDDDVRQFKLDHGYRAQTHLGAHLMYHCIIEAARNVSLGRARKEDRELSDFLDKIYQAGEHARVFILGSIFGGTGASSIPIIPKALRDAVRIKDKNAEIHPNARFGCSLLTDYFNFNVPDAKQKKEQKVVADSSNFSRNSQAALMFYDADATVKSTYKIMYHIGWPSRADFSQGDSSHKTITGGAEQTNPSHVTELLAACAAADFFGRDNATDDLDGSIVYKSANFTTGSFDFDFQDFFGALRSKEFMNKLGALFAFSHIVINAEKGGFGQNGVDNLAKKFKEFNIPDYVNLPADDARDLDDYVKQFAFSYDNTGNVVPGWLFQVRQSVTGPFLFQTDAFSQNQKQLSKFNFGRLFTDDSHNFMAKKMIGTPNIDDAYQAFWKFMTGNATLKPSEERQKVTRLNERLLAHSYNGLTRLFKILDN